MWADLIWFDIFDLFDLMISFDLIGLQSPQLVEHLCSARMNWDLNKVIIKLLFKVTGNHVKFARFLLLAVSEEAKTWLLFFSFTAN